MRTTLNIDDDVYADAREIAAAEKRSLGAVISSLARKGLITPRSAQGVRNGVPLLPLRSDARPVTPEFVRRLRDESE